MVSGSYKLYEVRELYRDYYKHFKQTNEDGDELVYRVYDVCEDTETGEVKVYYMAMYGDNKRYVREIGMFLSLTDKEKYPDSTQTHRFERMSKNEIKQWKKRNKAQVRQSKKRNKLSELITLMSIIE